MKRPPFVLAGLALFAGLLFVPTADAQILTRWFGSKSTDKNQATKSPQIDTRRIIEINVEIAWLADPTTFPYYLEAHATANQLEVRGFVPGKEVREQAIRIAQLHSSIPVVDSLKEHPSLMVKTTQLSPQQLQRSVQSSLKVALPKQHAQLKTECGADGTVAVVGNVSTFEEKVAVSQALRRLHGCTSVQNLTTLPAELTANLRDKTPIVKTSNTSSAENSSSWWQLAKGIHITTEEPPLLDPPGGEPTLFPSIPELKTPPKTEIAKPSAAELKKRIQQTCPQVKSIEVQFTSAKDVTITLEIRAESELTPTFQRVIDMPELQIYRPEIQFKIVAH